MASRQSPPPPIDPLAGKELEKLSADIQESINLRELKFVNPFPEEVQSECSICIMILNDPQIVTCCGHRFCQQCIGKVGRRGSIGLCPLCKSQQIQYFPDKTLARQINQRKVYCPLRNDGCMWTGELNKVTDHLDVHESGGNAQPCLFFPVPCEYCGEYVRRHKTTAHQASCSSRPTNCKFCDEEVSNDFLKDHYKRCTACPVYCTNLQCSEIMTRFTLKWYHLDHCKWSLVDCKFKDAGCNARIYRKDMEEHLQSNMEKHLDLLSQELEKQKLRQEELEEEKEDLFRTLLEKVDKLEDEAKSKGEIQFLVISDLPEEALYDEQKLKSRFGQYGLISDIYLLDPSLNAGIVVYSNNGSYQNALDNRHGIRLCKQLVKVNPVYATSDD